jgi:hypothetical protein
MGMRDLFRAIMAEPGEGSAMVEVDGKVYEVGKGKTVRLATVTRAPTREAFDAWREHPVTLFVFQALRAVAEEQEASWNGQSWHGGICDPLILNGLRARADAYNSIQDGDYEAYCAWVGVEPDGENSAA